MRQSFAHTNGRKQVTRSIAPLFRLLATDLCQLLQFGAIESTQVGLVQPYTSVPVKLGGAPT